MCHVRSAAAGSGAVRAGGPLRTSNSYDPSPPTDQARDGERGGGAGTVSLAKTVIMLTPEIRWGHRGLHTDRVMDVDPISGRKCLRGYGGLWGSGSPDSGENVIAVRPTKHMICRPTLRCRGTLPGGGGSWRGHSLNLLSNHSDYLDPIIVTKLTQEDEHSHYNFSRRFR